MSAACIYVLCDPRTAEVRYVGKSVNPQLRLGNHIKEAKKAGHKNRKNAWIASLLSAGVRPELRVIETCVVDNWKERECFWIGKYRKSEARLLNLKDGGEGLNPSPESRALMSAAKRGKAPHNKGISPSDETRRKQSEAAKRKFARMTPQERETSRQKVVANLPRDPISEVTRERLRQSASQRVYSDANKRAISEGLRSLTPEETEAIRLLIAQGVFLREIARRFNRSLTTISNIKTGRSYRA